MEALKKFFTNLRVSFSSGFETLQSNGKALVITSISAILLMFSICIAVFFIAVKGPEEVLVPNVIGKPLAEGLLEMQVKELFPKIQLRYSNTPGDEGLILEQNPPAGAIVKASRYINLVVSRGVVVDQVEDYTGTKIDDLKIKLQTLFSGSTKPLIILDEPLYKADLAEAGTILEQDPPAGTHISEPVTVKLVVSRGPAYEKTRVPNLLGMSVNDVLTQMSRSKIIFDFDVVFESTIGDGAEKTGIIINQAETEEFITNYGRVNATFRFPTKPVNGNVYNLFATNLPSYPYPLSMSLEATSPEGEKYTLVSFSHSGGSLTIPYSLPAGTILVLYVEGQETAKHIVNK